MKRRLELSYCCLIKLHLHLCLLIGLARLIDRFPGDGPTLRPDLGALEGRLRPELSAVDALRACFPAGTLSGAPKVRAMEIIEELEPTRRGIYGGGICYADYSGNLDSCIAIRSMLVKDGVGYIQAGAGIVADSVPEREYEECRNKAQAVLRAVERARNI